MVGKIPKGFFVDLPAVALFFIIILLIVGIILSIIYSSYLLIELCYDLIDLSFEKFYYIRTVTALIELGLFITLTYIIALGLFDFILYPIIVEKKPLDLGSLRNNLDTEVKASFLSLVISLMVLLILDTSTYIVQSYGQQTGIGYVDVAILLALALATLIISFILYLGKKDVQR